MPELSDESRGPLAAAVRSASRLEGVLGSTALAVSEGHG